MKGTGMKAVWDRLRSWKYASWVLYGTLLLLAGFFYGLGEGWFQAAPRDGPAAATEDTLEARLEDILSTVRGAGKVRVLVTYATAGERVAATVSTLDESVSETSGVNTATRSEQSREMKQPATVATEGGHPGGAGAGDPGRHRGGGGGGGPGRAAEPSASGAGGDGGAPFLHRGV